MTTLRHMYTKPRRTFRWVYLVLAAIATIALLSNCSAVKKTTHKLETETSSEIKKGVDTTKTITQASQATSSSTTVTGSEENLEAETELNVEFVPTRTDGITAADYMDTTIAGTRITGNGPASSITVSPTGDIQITGNIKNANYKGKGTRQKKDSTRTTDTASGSQLTVIENKGIDTTTGKTVTKTKETDTKKVKIGSPAGVWIPALIGIVVLGFCAWKFGWLKKRKQDPANKNNNPLVKSTYSPPAPPSPPKS